MLAIITGTIRPSKNVKQLVLRDMKERLVQYEDGIRFLIESGAFHKIVFCENSNYGVDSLSNLSELAGENSVELELLSFHGDEEKTCTYGKGYGEGEIVRYVLEHSKLIQSERYFVKITGRLKVDNICDIVRCLQEDRTYFNIPNRTRRDIYDTRLYAMPITQFQEFFLHANEHVKDDQGIYLETVYTDILKKHKIRVNNFPRYPRIIGLSGSGGTTYSYIEWKCKIRDYLSKVNYYRVK